VINHGDWRSVPSASPRDARHASPSARPRALGKQHSGEGRDATTRVGHRSSSVHDRTLAPVTTRPPIRQSRCAWRGIPTRVSSRNQRSARSGRRPERTNRHRRGRTRGRLAAVRVAASSHARPARSTTAPAHEPPSLGRPHEGAVIVSSRVDVTWPQTSGQARGRIGSGRTTSSTVVWRLEVDRACCD